MNRFINKVEVEGKPTAPSFVNNTPNVEAIQRASTTGNRLNDIVLGTAIKYAQKLDDMKRSNEIAQSKIALQRELQNYELSWQDKDRFSDENYSAYQDGLNNIYEKARMDFADTKYTREEDVLSWGNQIDSQKDTSLYQARGAKADYDIKKTTTESITNANALLELYQQNGDDNLKVEAINMLNNLENIGVPRHKIEEMKIKQLINADKNMLEIKINEVINNPNLSIDEKRKQVLSLQKNLLDDGTYKTATQIAIDEGGISKEFADAYENQLKATYKQAFLKEDGIVDRLNTQIRNEQYRIDTAIENDRLRAENEKLKAKNDVIKAYKSGNDYKVISTIEGREISPYEMVVNQDLSKKYYGRTPEEILNDNGYIPTHSIYEINDIKNKARVDEDNRINRDVTVDSIYDDILNKSENENEFKNSERELIVNGVITQLEANIHNGQAKFEYTTQDSSIVISKSEAINNANVGRKNSSYNKIRDFVGLSAKSDLYKKIEGLDGNKKHMVSEMIVGSILNTKFSTLFGGKDITIGTVNAQYNNNPDFREYVNAIINGVSGMDNSKYKKANLLNEDYGRKIEDRFNDEQATKVRRTTLESGTEPYVETYKDVLSDF